MTEEYKFTEKQSKFIDEFLVDLNATQAAIRAGYSEDSARQVGSQNLSKAYIAEEIARRRKIQSEKTGLTIENIDRELLEYLATCKQVPIVIDGEEYYKYDVGGVGKAIDIAYKRIGGYETKENDTKPFTFNITTTGDSK